MGLTHTYKFDDKKVDPQHRYVRRIVLSSRSPMMIWTVIQMIILTYRKEVTGEGQFEHTRGPIVPMSVLCADCPASVFDCLPFVFDCLASRADCPASVFDCLPFVFDCLASLFDCLTFVSIVR